MSPQGVCNGHFCLLDVRFARERSREPLFHWGASGEEAVEVTRLSLNVHLLLTRAPQFTCGGAFGVRCRGVQDAPPL